LTGRAGKFYPTGVNAGGAANSQNCGFPRGSNYSDVTCLLRACYNFNDTVTKPKFQPPGFRRMAAQGEEIMKNPLDSLWGTVICGVLLTAVLYFVVKSLLT
jgi:hypothetical protein